MQLNPNRGRRNPFRLLFRAERMRVVERPVTAAETGRPGNRALYVGAGAVDCVLDAEPLGEASCDR